MPELFWNAGTTEKKKGLDVLDLRGVDQDLERLWVAGITTISFRARYLSMLSWLCAEWFNRLLNRESDAVYDEKELRPVLRRFEAVVFFATHHGRARGLTGGTFGVLGSDLLREEASRLDSGESIEVPSSKGGGSLATYFMPCRAFGLMDWGSPGARLPFSVPQRGQGLWNARRDRVADTRLQKLIFEGGAISNTDLDAEGEYFSVNEIGSIPRELELCARRSEIRPVGRSESRPPGGRFILRSSDLKRR